MSEDVELPEGWARVPFETVLTELRNGVSTKPELKPPGTPILRINAVRPGRVLLDDLRYLPHGQDLAATSSVRDGDLLFTRYNGSLELLGVCGIVRGVGKTTLLYPDKLMRARFDESVVTPPFVELFFQSPDARERLVGQAKSSAGQQGISGSALKRQPLAIAPLSEQRRIVERVETLLAQVKKAKDRLDRVKVILKRFRQAVLAAACSGKLTEAWRGNDGVSVTEDEENLPSGWRWHQLSELALPEPSAICAGPFGTIFKAHDFRDEGVPIIFLRHVAPGEYRTTKPGFMDRTKWEELFRPYSVWGGELLVTKLGDPPGTCALYPKGLGPAMVTPDVIKMSVDEGRASPHFLMHYLNSEPARRRAFGVAYGATRARMNLEIFRSLRVPLPPLQEQHEVVRRVGGLLSFATTVEQRLQAATEGSNKLPQSILSKAFRGELVPTEADLARTEGRSFESAEEMLERVKMGNGFEAEKGTRPRRGRPS